MKVVRAIIYLLVLCLLWSSSYAALLQQNAQKEISLADALKQLTEHYRVNFIYEDKTLNEKMTVSQAGLFSESKITKTLNRILPSLGLAWFNIDDKNYAIFPINNKPKINLAETVNPALNYRQPDTLQKDYIKGYVSDENHSPLQFATISLLRAADSTVISNVLSDTSGQYRFVAIKPGNYKIRVVAMGYQTTRSSVFTLTENSGLSMPLLLVKSVPQKLKEVEITSSRPMVERKNDRFILNVANSPMATGNSLQVLRSAPFVNVSPDNDVSLQGKKTMILIDGRPVPDAALLDILQSLPAGNIASIELITDPSARYDASYGAVINIITKKDQTEGLTGTVRSELTQGDFMRGDANARLTYKQGNITLFGSGGYSRFNFQTHDDTYRDLTPPGVQDQVHEQIVRTFHSNAFNFQAGGNIDITKNESIGTLIDGRTSVGPVSFNSIDGFSKIGGPLDSVLTTKSPLRNTSYGFDYNLNYHLSGGSGKNDLAVFTTLSPIKRTIAQNFTSVLTDGDGNTIGIPAPYQSANTYQFLIFVAQADYSRVLERNWKMETGVKYQSTDSKQAVDFKTDSAGQFLTVPQNSSNNHLAEDIMGAYGILSKKWVANFLRFGLRLEHSEDRYIGFYNLGQTELFPSLLYTYDLNKENNVSFSYRRTVERAPYAELVPYRIEINPYNIGIGNPLLKPQFNNTFAVNTKIKYFNISLNYVATAGLIAQTPASEDFVHGITYIYYQNLARASDLFIDVFYPLQFTSWWNTQNSGTVFGYANASGTVLNEPFSVSSARFALRSNQTFKLSGRVKLEVDGYYNSSRTDGLTHNGGYGNIDAGLQVDVLQGKGQLKLNGQDILHRTVYFTSQDFGVYSTYRDRYFDYRAATLSFSYNFGQTKIKTPAKKLGNEDAVGRSN